MGASTSSPTKVAQVFPSAKVQAAFERITGKTHIPREDVAYHTVLSSTKPFPQLSQTQVELLTREYGERLALNSLESRNFCVLVRNVIHALPFSCRVAKMTEKQLTAFAPGAVGADLIDGTPQTVEMHLHRAVNALFLVRQFTMRFVERTDECSLLAHFQYKRSAEVAASETTSRHNLSIQMEAETASYNDAFALFPPNEKTYDLHVEVVNTLLVLLSPVVYPRDHSKQAGDLHLHNPFLYMLMVSAIPQSKKSYWASGVIYRLLQNSIDQLQATGPSLITNTAMVALQMTQEMSLVAMSGISDHEYDEDQFSYFTLEGVGSIAASIVRFPWSFMSYFTTREGTASPLADRSVLLLLVLLQSCRDSDSLVTSNPFRGALCGITDDAGIDSQSTRAYPMQHGGASQSLGAEKLELSFSDLFKVIGSHAPYEASHLMLYTLLYSNPIILDRAVSDADIERLLLPLLETLYHARCVEPSRLYMLVVVLLTFTQDQTFVHTAHTQLIVPNVSWYQKHYMVDVSLGSLMMVIFTRLIIRNITHFQDSFIHLNAFAALSNLARSAENLHMCTAQGIVELIDMLVKNEAKLVIQMKRLKATDKEKNNVLTQRHSAYVEFIRLLLGVVSSCLKAKLLPRNPQLIYSVLHRADTFAALRQHSEFAAHVHNGPVWSTLARFQAVLDAKTSSDDVLDADMVLDIIRGECVNLLAASNAGSRAGDCTNARRFINDDDTSYRYEEETDPEQFFVPYIWKHIQEQTPDFCWKVDKITLFVPSCNSAPTHVVTS
ncbi:unnamed protein product [Peronospora destructor]|uniref:Dymeclin n=1 Tax=Peronospora destructor TaxID=86335 RepID=A0AAV0UBU6_9STRA|nr:unnamed protein product [Peronospora destructor]